MLISHSGVEDLDFGAAVLLFEILLRNSVVGLNWTGKEDSLPLSLSIFVPLDWSHGVPDLLDLDLVVLDKNSDQQHHGVRNVVLFEILELEVQDEADRVLQRMVLFLGFRLFIEIETVDQLLEHIVQRFNLMRVNGLLFGFSHSVECSELVLEGLQDLIQDSLGAQLERADKLVDSLY